MKTWQWILVGIGALVVFRRPAGDYVTEAAQDINEGVKTIVAITSQDALANERKYAPYIASAEKKYGIPTGVLHRLITAESHFRSDIITGKTRSAVGATGIAQFMPATAAELGVNPLDPIASIDAAGRYLKTILGWTGGNDWTKAVAAYNWGAGNVNKAVKTYGINWLAYGAPKETRDYVAKIIV